MTTRDTEAEVRAAAAAWSDAIFRRDVEAAGQFLAPEYALMAPVIGELSRARWLEMLPVYVIESYEFSNIRVQSYGEFAVMRSRYAQVATVAGADRSGSMFVTDTWVFRDGRWQVVARHTSFVDPAS